MRTRRIRLPLFFLGLILSLTDAIDLDGVIEIEQTTITEGVTTRTEKFFAPRSTFSSQSRVSGFLELAPDDNPYICNETNNTIGTFLGNTILLIPRGYCSFEKKAAIAESRYGVRGVLIYNTLESRYIWNETTQRIQGYPRNMFDYECSNGGTTILSNSSIQLDPPRYQSNVHDPLLTFSSDSNICFLPDPAACPSQRCLILNRSLYACCAWDVPMVMAGDGTVNNDESSRSVSMFLTMQQGDDLREQVLNGDEIYVTMYYRAYPMLNPSAILLWLGAVFLVAGGSWLSAKSYRRMNKTLTDRRFLATGEVVLASDPYERLPPRAINMREYYQEHHTAATERAHFLGRRAEQARQQRQPDVEQPVEDMQECREQGAPSPSRQGESSLPSSVNTQEARASSSQQRRSSLSFLRSWAGSSARQNAATSSTGGRRSVAGSNPDVVEISMWHAVAFVVVASVWLILLFYFKFYDAVTVLYGVACAGAVSHVLIKPVLSLMFRGMSRATRSRKQEQQSSDTSTAPSTTTPPAVCWKQPIRAGWMSRIDLLALVLAYAHCAAWIYVFFTVPEPIQNTFYWVSQDIMGICLSIAFFQLIQLNTIKVATVLLIVIFIYDIFFVFITPFLFDGDSVMVEVATGGGPPKEGISNDCDKYPELDGCKAGNPLPLLFIVPRINDYHGGANLLGLGDVLLPGLLVSFCARLDAAKRLVAMHTDLFVAKAPIRWYQGYLVALTVAYAIGLLAALVAVVLMDKGQPALLYIVPACMGMMFIIGRHEIRDLWKGPIEINWANRIVYNVSHGRVRLRRDLSILSDNDPEQRQPQLEAQDSPRPVPSSA